MLALAAVLALGAAPPDRWAITRKALLQGRLQAPALTGPDASLQQALLSYYQGHSGQAWALMRRLEAGYTPGGQPPEFFWLRGLLLESEQPELAKQNWKGLLSLPCAPELRLEALLALSRGDDAEAEQYAREATRLAARLGSPLASLRLALARAHSDLDQGKPQQALGGLLVAQQLAAKISLPDLEAQLLELSCTCLSRLGETAAVRRQAQRLLALQSPSTPPLALVDLWLRQGYPAAWLEARLIRLPASQPRLRALARLQARGLNQRAQAQRTLARALSLCSAPEQRLEVRAELVSLTRGAERRAALLLLIEELRGYGALEAHHPLRRLLPVRGCSAALAETYLPDRPEQAQIYFQQALSECTTPLERLELLNYQLTRYQAAGALPWARRTLNQVLEAARQTPSLDQDSARILRQLMFSLRSENRQFPRLLMADQLQPAPESPSLLLLSEALRDQTLQSALERSVAERLERARASADPRQLCDAYLARAELLSAQERWAEAMLVLERALQTAPSANRRALTLRLVAEANWRLGRRTRASQAIERAEKLFDDPERSRECRLLRAYYLLRRGQTQEALQLCRSESGQPWFRFLEGRCWLESGRFGEARAAFAALPFEEGLAEVGRLIYLAGAQRHLNQVEAANASYAQAYRLAQGLGSLSLRDVCLAWSPWLRQQGRTEEAARLEEETTRSLEAMIAEYPQSLRERLLDLPATQQLLARTRPDKVAPAASPQAPEPDRRRQTRREFLASLNEVRQRYPDLDAALGVTPGDLAALQEQLPAHKVLLQYYSGGDDLYIMRIDSEGCRVVPVAVERAQLQGWVDELRLALSRRGPIPRLAAHRLYASLIAPIAADLSGKQVQVIPNHWFWYLPWDALLDDQGRYLVESYDISAVSPVELLRPATPPLPEDRVIALGGVDRRLPATEAEARMVGSLFAGSEVLLGEQASSASLRRLAPQASLVHIASHSGLSQDLNGAYVELADGRLTLEQVYGLELRRGSLVVLSSCESSLGQIEPGRDVSSLATAFLAGGASSVLATLWQVEDQPSAAFFRRFYTHLSQGRPLSAALRQARLDSLSEGPSCWAAYQLIGNPDSVEASAARR